MKIVHIINNLNKGGAERLLVEVLPYYVAAGHEVVLLQLSDLHSEPQYIELLETGGVQVFSLGKGKLYDPGHILKLKNWIGKHKPQIVHAHLFPTMYWIAGAAALGMKVPIIFTEHSTQNNRFSKAYFKPIDRIVYSQFAKIVAISQAIYTKLSIWIGKEEQLLLIRNGVAVQKFIDASAYSQQEKTEIFQHTSNKKICLMTARFLFPKDHKTVVDTLSYLPPEYSIAFAGVGEGLEEIKKYAADRNFLERIIFLGFRNDVPRLMKSVCCNILSSEYEGMSGVACEAMAAGVPFFGTDVPGINDVVPDKRYLFEVKNPAQLSERICSIMANHETCDSLVADGLAQAKSFDIQIMIENHLSLYSELAQ